MADNMPTPPSSSGNQATQEPGDPSNQAGEGFHAVAQTIVNAEFPADRARLIEEIGDEEVEIVKGETVTMRDVLAELPDRRFETDVEFRQALEDNWEGIANLRGTHAEVREEEEAEAPRGQTRTPTRTTTRGTRRMTAAKKKPNRAARRKGPNVNQGRTTRRNAGAKGSNRDARKRGGKRGGNERAGGKSGNQRPGGRARQQRGSKTQRASRQRKQALGARNKQTRGRRTGAVPGRKRAPARKR